MPSTILITGSTDGIGLETAKKLASQGHHVLLHGRSSEKLAAAENTVKSVATTGDVKSYIADLSDIDDVEKLAANITNDYSHIDVVINNAGILGTNTPIASNGLDVRFMVNTIAPYLLTQRLLPLMDATGRVVNLSSAAQAPISLEALEGKVKLNEDLNAYAQSKLAITSWSRSMALKLADAGPAVIAVNPGSLLATKMVKEGFGVAGHDIGIGADILIRAALSDEFAAVSGQYYDNDSHQFAAPHPDALDTTKATALESTIEGVLSKLTS